MTSSLFAWQRALIASGLPDNVRLTALRIGLDSAQTTGREVVINDGQVAEDVGCSPRTVWRRVEALIAAGWLIQTAKPTYTGGESRGRRARYELRVPGESPDTASGDLSDDSPEVVGQGTRGDGTRPRKLVVTGSPGVAHDDPSRLPNRGQSSATTTAGDGTLSASNGSSNAAAAARELPIAVEILRKALEAHNLVVRWNILTLAELTEVEDLVALHGDGPLIQSALRGYQPNRPAATARAWLPGWRELRAPGDLALVRQQLCSIHSTQLSSSGACSSCAADQKAVKTS